MIKELNLTNDQINALDKLEEWLLDKTKSKSRNFFSLVGSAGTGKTTLIKMFIEKARLIIGDSICISAPTHKAKKEIEKKTGWKYSETLQKLLGLKLDVMIEMFDINNPAFSIMGETKMEDYKLVIIDEGSMVNKDLYELVCKLATQYFNNIKVLFCGDLMQLSPVNEYAFSKCLTEPIDRYELTEIVRQKEGNPLLELLTVLREDIKNQTEYYKQYLESHKSEFNKKGEGYSCLNSKEFGEALKNEFSSISYRENANYLRYLTWTNIVVEKSNLWIRKNVFNFTNQLNKGEILLSYKNIMDGDTPIIFNSDDYKVNNVEDIIDKDLGIALKRVKLLNIALENEMQVNIVDSNSMAKFSIHFKEELSEAVRLRNKKRWMAYYAFKDQYLLLGNMYEQGKVLCKKDLDYGYCLSIHKS